MGRVVRPFPITYLRRPPKCTVFINFFFMEGFQRGRAQSLHEPRFYLRRFIGGFSTWGVLISWHVPRFKLLKLADVVRFLSAIGPWWACHFPFLCFVCVCFFFERDIKAPGFPAYPLSLQRSFRFNPAWVRPLLLGGMDPGPYAGPCLFRT